VQYRAVLVLAGAVGCLGALTAVAGSVDAPATAGVAYEVTVPWESLFQRGDTAANRLVRPQSGGDDGRWVLGPTAIRTYLGQLVVLTGWLVVAFRQMDRAAGVLSGLTVGVVAVVLYVLTVADPATGGAGTTLLSDVPVTVRIYLLAAVVVAVTAAVRFSLPAHLQRPEGRGVTLPSLSRDGGASDGRAEATTTADPSPSNPVERAWWAVASDVDPDSWATRTPREIERAADDRSPGAVRELRRLFEQVRYGDAPISDDRVERAQRLRERLVDADAEAADIGDDPGDARHGDDGEGSG
jgi:hypothetical protein